LAWSDYGPVMFVLATCGPRRCKVGWLEFNVPFQHKYSYIRDEMHRYKEVLQGGILYRLPNLILVFDVYFVLLKPNSITVAGSKPNYSTLSGSKLVTDWFEADWRPASNQIA